MRTSYVRTELEYLLTVSRSTFDLLQKSVAFFWNKTTKLNDPELEARRKKRKLPDSFTKMVLTDRHIVRPATELMDQYTLPPLLAEGYTQYASFYAALMQARDRIMHRGGSVETIFDTEKGFCVDPKAKTFASFAWKPEHHYNENLVSLLPWIAYVIYGTIEACNEIMIAYARSIVLPPEIAPEYRVFIRDPANRAIIRLGSVASGQTSWWSDSESPGPRSAGSPPKIPKPEDGTTPKDAYRNGDLGLTSNEHEAIRFFALAAVKNVAVAQYEIGMAFRDGLGGLPKDSDRSFYYLGAAADKCNVEALLQLAEYFRYGEYGVDQSSYSAVAYYIGAIRCGHRLSTLPALYVRCELSPVWLTPA